MPFAQHARPVLNSGLSAAEFLRWYWLKDGLTESARMLGIRAADSKDS